MARTRRDRTLLLPVMHIIRKPFPDVSQMASVAAPQTHHHHSLVLRLAHGTERIHIRLAARLVASRHARVDLLIPKVLRSVPPSPLSLLPRRRRNRLAARHDERNAFHRRVALRSLRQPPVRRKELRREVEVLLVLLRRRLKGDLGSLSLTKFLRSHVVFVFRHSNNRTDFAHSHQFFVALLARQQVKEALQPRLNLALRRLVVLQRIPQNEANCDGALQVALAHERAEKGQVLRQ